MDLPTIISVDDHVVEPAHVFERWLPAKYRDRGAKVVRRGIQRIDMINPGNYKEVFDDDSPTKARASGRDMASVLAELTRQRSHRRASGFEAADSAVDGLESGESVSDEH